MYQLWNAKPPKFGLERLTPLSMQSLRSIKLPRIGALWLIRVVGMFRVGSFLCNVRRRSCCWQETCGIRVAGSIPWCLWLWGRSLSWVPCGDEFTSLCSTLLPRRRSTGAVPSGPWAWPLPLPRCVCVSPHRHWRTHPRQLHKSTCLPGHRCASRALWRTSAAVSRASPATAVGCRSAHLLSGLAPAPTRPFICRNSRSTGGGKKLCSRHLAPNLLIDLRSSWPSSGLASLLLRPTRFTRHASMAYYLGFVAGRVYLGRCSGAGARFSLPHSFLVCIFPF
jgi:hypothetical protein